MNIKLEDLGKRFNKQWVFRGLSTNLTEAARYVILGSNGSGKSTLLQTIAGFRVPSEGSVEYFSNGKLIDPDKQYNFISIASPYLTLIEEFNIDELLDFHFGLKPYVPGMNRNDFIAMLQMHNIKGKQVRQYSSGMKQRLRLALAFFTDAPVLLLDEPCSNLDAQGVAWYRNLLGSYSQNRLVIICSNNQVNEYEPCNNIINISDYKSANAVKSG